MPIVKVAWSATFEASNRGTRVFSICESNAVVSITIVYTCKRSRLHWCSIPPSTSAIYGRTILRYTVFTHIEGIRGNDPHFAFRYLHLHLLEIRITRVHGSRGYFQAGFGNHCPLIGGGGGGGRRATMSPKGY